MFPPTSMAGQNKATIAIKDLTPAVTNPKNRTAKIGAIGHLKMLGTLSILSAIFKSVKRFQIKV